MTHLWSETPILFSCEGEQLLGVLALPEQPLDTGVLIVVGGPEYRAGSHRQFTLLARHLANEGIASCRFDYRGMGDSEGAIRYFESVDADIGAAIDAFMAHMPQLRRIVLWGLCDAASAALYYAHRDARVSGVMLLNPWVRNPASQAKARLKHYYLRRIMQGSFWLKLFTGGVRVGNALGDLTETARQTAVANTENTACSDPRHGSSGYVERMLSGFEQFRGEVLLILSGDDLTAQEFTVLCQDSPAWKRCVRRTGVKRVSVKEADHTFSSHRWRDEVAELSRDWVTQHDHTAGGANGVNRHEN